MSAEDPMQLTDDLLADVLRCLQTSPRSLAAASARHGAPLSTPAGCSRTSCRTRWPACMFVHLHDQMLPKYFPLVPPTDIAAFDYLDTQDVDSLMIRQHCNGLLLLGDEEVMVLNPGTRQWACLPPPPPMSTPGMEDMYDVDDPRFLDCHEQCLVFDPTESPYYEVFLVKHVPWIPWPDNNHLVPPHIKEREWPPAKFVLLVFSSRTNQWEERPFVREGEAARTIGYMLEAFPSEHPYAVYSRGSLYIRQFDFILRITLSSQRYQVIELPESPRRNWYACRLGKSKKGLYCVPFDRYAGLGVQIWYLDETCDQINWMLKCEVNLHPLLANFSKEHSDSPCNVQCASCDEDDRTNATGTKDGLEQIHIRYSLLGFHPNEKIVFFHTPLKRVLAYYFDSSKIEDLGFLPTEPQDCIYFSFPYTPLSDKRVFNQ